MTSFTSVNLRVFPLLILCVCFQLDVRAQLLEMSGLNVYSNYAWVADSIVGIRDEGAGFRFWDGQTRWKRLNMRDGIGLDSNSYSSIDYILGGNATQQLVGKLERPVDESSVFRFDLKRESMPGWMTRSFARRTDVDISYQRQFAKRWVSFLGVGVDSWDREQNGGLTGDAYSISEDATGTFGLVYGDIFLTNAYNRSVDYWVTFENAVSLLDREKSTLDVCAVGSFGYGNYQYEDELPDDAYYRRYTPYALESVYDSLSNRTLRGGTFLRWSTKGDSVRSSQLLVGADFYSHKVVNNGQEFLAANQELYAKVDGFVFGFDYSLKGSYWLNGYNQGDHRSAAQIDYTLAQMASDSNGQGGLELAAFIRAKSSLTRPALIYERYNSSVFWVRNPMDKVGRILLEGGIRFESGKLSAQLAGGVDERTKFIYVDSNAQAHQMTEPLRLTYGAVKLQYAGEHFHLMTDWRYQWNKRSVVYSLPEWVNTSLISTRWPLLKKRLAVELGARSYFFSSYYARGYVPFFDVYYTQTDRRFGDYLQLDAFVKFTIKTVDVSLSGVNLAYGVFSDEALVGPNYPGLPRYFQVGVTWKFRN